MSDQDGERKAFLESMSSEERNTWVTGLFLSHISSVEEVKRAIAKDEMRRDEAIAELRLEGFSEAEIAEFEKWVNDGHETFKRCMEGIIEAINKASSALGLSIKE